MNEFLQSIAVPGGVLAAAGVFFAALFKYSGDKRTSLSADEVEFRKSIIKERDDANAGRATDRQARFDAEERYSQSNSKLISTASELADMKLDLAASEAQNLLLKAEVETLRTTIVQERAARTAP